VRSKRGINTLRKKKLSNKTAAQRCVWRFYTVTLKNSLNRRFPKQKMRKPADENWRAFLFLCLGNLTALVNGVYFIIILC
jgi:hypothetical protein